MKKIVVANWKLNPQTLEEAKDLYVKYRAFSREGNKTKVIVCPPYIYASSLANLAVKTGDPKVGVQDVFFENSGSWTGEIGPSMLKNIGMSYGIIGHSERRSLGETDEVVNKKVLASLASGISPIVCIGENIRDSHGDYLSFLKEQLVKALNKVTVKDLKNVIIAYEPVWAIGKKDSEAITPRDLRVMSIYIRKILSDIYGQKEVSSVPVLYGGSVSQKIAQNIIEEGKVQGLLVGRSSLDAEEFLGILKITENSKS